MFEENIVRHGNLGTQLKDVQIRASIEVMFGPKVHSHSVDGGRKWVGKALKRSGNS